MRQEAPPEEEQRLQLQLEALDRKTVIEEIVEQEKLSGYRTAADSEDECELVAYVRGDYNRLPENEFV